jgi:hypothetical protein
MKHGSMGSTTASETVSLHHAGETLALAHTMYMNFVAWTENGHLNGVTDFDFLRGLVLSRTIESELAKDSTRSHAGFLEMSL